MIKIFVICVLAFLVMSCDKKAEQKEVYEAPNRSVEWYDERALESILTFLNKSLEDGSAPSILCKKETLNEMFEEEFIRKMRLAALNSVLDYSLNRNGIIQEWIGNVNIFRVGRELNPFFIALIEESQYPNSRMIIERDFLDSTTQLKITESIEKQINNKRFIEFFAKGNFQESESSRLVAAIPFSCAVYEMVMQSNSTGGKIIVDYVTALLSASHAGDQEIYDAVIKKILKNN